ncbi:MAG: bifunctional UDP-sugar hydrolase/5'-nucleotidase [Candidatus Eisenbacteria bacterium]
MDLIKNLSGIVLGLIMCLVAAGLGFAGEAKPIDITIMHTNDVHGGIDPTGATFMDEEFPPLLGGGASLARLADDVRTKAAAEGQGFLLLDTGDIWQGTPVGNYRAGEVVIEFMNRVGYDAWVPGNHEFDAGLDNAFKIFKMAKFPVLGANIVDKTTGQIPAPFVPYIIKEAAGVKIGIIGIITEETEFYSTEQNLGNFDLIAVKPVIQKYMAELRPKVDLIFVLGHIGIPFDVWSAYREMIETGSEQKIRYGMNAMELVHYTPGIDVLIGGHIHVGLEGGWEDPVTHTICLQTYGRGTGVGVYDLNLDPRTRQIIGYTLPEADGSIVTLYEDEYWPKPEISEFLSEKIDSAEVGMDQPIGRALVDLTRVGVGESVLGNLVTDAMGEAVDADVAFTNLGGIRANIHMGVITARDVFNAVPFENRLVYYDMTGSFLKLVLEWRVKGMRQGAYVSGIKIVYSRALPDFDRLTLLTVGGKPWDPDSLYRVATTDFIASGNIGLEILTQIDPKYVHKTDILVKDAIVDYIQRHSPLDRKLEGRFLRDDAAQYSPEILNASKRIKDIKDLTH